MGTPVFKHIIIAIGASLFLNACSDSPRESLTSPGVVQFESPPPVEHIPAHGFSIKNISAQNIVRVRVFPLMSAPAQDPYPPTKNPYAASLYNSAGLEAYSVSTQKLLGAFNKIILDGKNKTLGLDGIYYALEEIYLHPQDVTVATTVQYDAGAVKVEYRGDFFIHETEHVTPPTPSPSGSPNVFWSIINYVDLEDYLQAVVPSEMPAYFGIEALKAQSVAARTYALFHMGIARTTTNTAWDVDPTTWYQSYRGALVESKVITPAVRATSGMVLTHSGQIIEAFFSANSGGMICTASECFGKPDRPYLVTKPDVNGVRAKPLGTWKTNADVVGIDARLRKLETAGLINLKTLIPGYNDSSDLSGLEAYEVGAAGRIARLALNLVNGTQVILSPETSKQMRWQFGMKSAFYELAAPANGQQAITGYGLGHGVGMSQWGAQVLAEQGQLFEDILNFYYNGIKIESL